MTQQIEAISRETEDRVCQLRLKRRNLITNFKYEDAINIEQEIASERMNSMKESVAVFLNEFKEIIEPYIQKSYEIQNKFLQERNEQIQDHKRKYDSYFKDLQKQHLESLSVIERKFQDDRNRENERVVPEQTNLLELSKKAAMQGDFKTALELRYNSRVVAQKSLIERQAKLEDEFRQQRDEMINSQASALEKMVKKFNEVIDGFNYKCQKKISSNNLSRNNQLISYYQRSLAKLVGLTKNSKKYRHEDKLQEILFTALDQYQFEHPSIPESANQNVAPAKKKSATQRINDANKKQY